MQQTIWEVKVYDHIGQPPTIYHFDRKHNVEASIITTYCSLPKEKKPKWSTLDDGGIVIYDIITGKVDLEAREIQFDLRT